MNLYLVRHGESVGNTKRGFLSGRTDPDGLTPRGRIQMIRSTWHLRKIDFSRVLTSPVARAKESAQIISSLFSTPLFIEEQITEFSYGKLEGHYVWEVQNEFPPEFRQKRKENFDTPYPEGESFNMLSRRVYDFLQKLTQKANGQTVLIVTHQAVIATLMYCAQYGDPHRTKEAYLRYVHSTFPPNSAIVHLLVREKTSSFQYITSEIPPVDTESISFYTAGVRGEKSNAFQSQHLATLSRNQVFLAKNQSSFILKLVSDQTTLGGRRLATLYTYLQKQTNVPSPHILHFDDSNQFFGDAVLMFDYLRGETLTTCVHQNHTSIPQLHRKLFAVLNNIHSIPSEGVRVFWTPHDWGSAKHPVWEEYIGGQIERILVQINHFDLSSETIVIVSRRLKKLNEYLAKDRLWKPIHGDVAPQNIIVDHAGKMCVFQRLVDFDRARIGDPVWDFVYYLGWLERMQKDVAAQWKTLCIESLKTEERIVFEEYRILFHAWTLLDTIDYKKDPERQRIGTISRILLEKLTSSPH